MNKRAPPFPSRPIRSRRSFQVDLALSPQQIKAFYAGQVTQVSARAADGVRLQFPLQSLRKFIDHEGIRGRFRIDVTAQNKLCGITRI